MKTTLAKNVAAVYIRVSTEKTAQKDSPEHQRGICMEKAMEEDLDVQYIYEDRSSGTSINGREDMQKLTDDAKKGFFDTIIFASLSRFARDLTDALNLRRLFVDALGIRLIAIDENYDSKVDVIEKDLKFQLYGMMNENLSKSISMSSKRGIRQSAKRGNFTGAHAPFGYKKIKNGGLKTLEIVENDANVVREIFNMYVNKEMGETRIVNCLNEEGIPSPRNGVWGITTVQRILQNEAYCGFNVYGKFQSKVVYDNLAYLENKRKKLIAKNREDWERNKEPNWEAIIEPEIFKRAQEIRIERGGGKRGGARNIKVNPFVGLIKCSHCGSSLTVVKSGKVGKNGQEYRYFRCSSRRRMGAKGCQNDLWIPLEQFKTQMIKKITHSLYDSINPDNLASTYEIPNKPQKIDSAKKIKECERSIALNRKVLANLRKDAVSGGIDEEQFIIEKEGLMKEINAFQKKISQLQKKQIEEDSEEKVRAQMKSALGRLVQLDYSNIEELQSILKDIIEEIKVDRDGEVEIYTGLDLLYL